MQCRRRRRRRRRRMKKRRSSGKIDYVSCVACYKLLCSPKAVNKKISRGKWGEPIKCASRIRSDVAVDAVGYATDISAGIRSVNNTECWLADEIYNNMIELLPHGWIKTERLQSRILHFYLSIGVWLTRRELNPNWNWMLTHSSDHNTESITATSSPSVESKESSRTRLVSVFSICMSTGDPKIEGIANGLSGIFINWHLIGLMEWFAPGSESKRWTESIIWHWLIGIGFPLSGSGSWIKGVKMETDSIRNSDTCIFGLQLQFAFPASTWIFIRTRLGLCWFDHIRPDESDEKLQLDWNFLGRIRYSIDRMKSRTCYRSIKKLFPN